VRPARSIAACAVLALVAGCDSGSNGEASERQPAERPPARTAPEAPRTGIRSYEGRVIRGWLLALDRGDYDEAAYYFAPGAIIDQGEPFRLPDESAAEIFSAGLPCRADLVELEDEGKTVLASFDLRRGPGGPCSGIVRVRYTIREGKIAEWRQLGQQDPPPGESI
jgi:hypothetical protein